MRYVPQTVLFTPAQSACPWRPVRGILAHITALSCRADTARLGSCYTTAGGHATHVAVPQRDAHQPLALCVHDNPVVALLLGLGMAGAVVRTSRCRSVSRTSRSNSLRLTRASLSALAAPAALAAISAQQCLHSV